MTQAGEERPIRPALLHGFRRRCPSCGKGLLFDGFLRVRNTCPVCGQVLHHHRADDAPAWATILVVGHLMIPVIAVARGFPELPMWMLMTATPLLGLALTILVLPSIKGAIIAYQWASRMHGFDEPPDGRSPGAADQRSG